MKTLPSARLPGRQGGVFAIMYAIILLPMLAMVGLALDLSMMYARRHEMQSVADGTALAAARALNGTTAGIATALASAQTIATQSQYRFLNPITVGWADNALRFGASAAGPWFTSGEINSAQAATMYFARVDTDRLDAALGAVYVSFIQVAGIGPVQNARAFAVAGRRDSAIAPLAICALAPEAVGHRANIGGATNEEVLEFGFRRGVSYDLLNLNPNGDTAVSYVFNPTALQGSIANDLADAVRPFVCTGSAPAQPIAANTLIAVRSPFPASLMGELNARFSPYPTNTACTQYSAPPDANVFDFRGWYAATPPVPLLGSATSWPVIGSKRVTVADMPSAPAGTTAASYGPLWSFAKPLKYDLANNVATTNMFSKTDWSNLYPVASGAVPSTTYAGVLPPYLGAMPPAEAAASPFKAVPKNSANVTIVGLPFRRVLNVPLLECPVTTASSARVLGIGRFMMTTKAGTAPAAIHAEFGGVTTYGALAASAVLYQ